MAAESTAAPATVSPKVQGALTRYRVMAYVVGVMLVLLVAVAMPLKYLAELNAKALGQQVNGGR